MKIGYKVSGFLAAILHLALVILFLIGFHPNIMSLNPAPNIIQATMVEDVVAMENTLFKEIPKKEIPKEISEENLVREKEEMKKNEQVNWLKKIKDQLQNAISEEHKVVKQNEKKETKKRLAEELNKQLTLERKSLANSRPGKKVQSEIDKYKALIIQTISGNWIVPRDLDQGKSCDLLIHLAPGGVVTNVELSRSSGNLALDRSAQTAVLKSSPLPIPKDTSLFEYFRILKLTVRPEGIS
jgi:colicin import membrane protein